MWTPVQTEDGSYTLAHPQHGETCHSRAGAWTESRERYASACRLRERARELRDRGETALRLLDVGTGLGLNLAAALEALEGTGVELDATSLEIDVGVIEATLDLGPHAALPELERQHVLVRAALRLAIGAKSEPVPLAGGRLRLLVGDGRATLPALAPGARFDAVFLDPFSPGVDPPLWSPEFLAEVARRMLPGSLLSTYTAAARARVGLLAAGLRVGPGARVGTKSSGTLASPDIELPSLDPRTTRRLNAKVDRLGAVGGGEPSGS
jgi:tRNA U34 5-methylaminomethyl-2-thiouridine-forming methyltransferase MnmC